MRFEFIVYPKKGVKNFKPFNFPIHSDNADNASQLADLHLANLNIKNNEIRSLGYIEF